MDDAGPRRIGSCRLIVDDEEVHTPACQLGGERQSGRSGADDQDIGGRTTCHGQLLGTFACKHMFAYSRFNQLASDHKIARSARVAASPDERGRKFDRRRRLAPASRRLTSARPEAPESSTGSKQSSNRGAPAGRQRPPEGANAMSSPRRRFRSMAAAAAACAALPRAARSEPYPARPVRIIVGFAPGGLTDLLARMMGQWLSERLGQQFVVENRPGASGNIATQAVVNAPAD